MRGVLKFVLRPSLVGALYMVALAIRAALGNVQDGQDLGNNKEQIQDFIAIQFGGEIRRVVLAIVLSAVVIGAILGTVSGLLISLRDRIALRTPPRSVWSLALSSLVITAVLHALLMLWGMAQSPQLYAEWWYARGGVWRTVQMLATDFLGPTGVVLIGVAFLLAYLAGPPSAWRQYPSRIGALLGKLQGQTKTVASIGAASGALLLLFFAVRSSAPRPAHAGDSAAAGDRASDKRPNVIILAADSLRADRIHPDITPNLVALAARGTRFDKAYVSLPRTFPSWVSILTGRHPHHHGIRSMFPRWEERAKDFDALPSRLAKAGYATGVVSDYAGDIFGRIDLGFETNDTPSFDFKQLVRQRALERETPLLPVLHSRLGRTFFPVLRELNDAADPDMLTSDALSAVKKLDGKPFFLTIFYSTAHFPYAAPAPYYRRFTDPDYDGRFKYHKPVGLGREAPPDERDIRQIQGLYDGAVQSIDDAIARLLEGLKSRGLEDNTIIIVTADHGETLYDHDHGQGHGDHLFGDEGTHVPLIIVDPRRKGAQRAGQIAREVDIAATLYELTGVETPKDLDGRSLVPALDGKPLAPAMAFAETGLWFTEEIAGLPAAMRLPYPGIAQLSEIDPQHNDEIVLQNKIRPLTRVAKHRMVRDERWKLVYVPMRSGVKYLLYDTQADPAESTDVAAAHADVTTRLRAELWSWMLRDAEMVERSGYLVPRDVSGLNVSGDKGIRLNDIGKDDVDTTQSAPPGAAQP